MTTRNPEMPLERKGIYYWTTYHAAEDAIQRTGVRGIFPNARVVETLRGYAIQIYTSGPYLPLTGKETHTFAKPGDRMGDVVKPYAENPRTREIGVHVYDYASAAKFLGNRLSRRLAPNTTVYAVEHVATRSTLPYIRDISVRLYNTDIVTYHPDGSITLRNGGHQTRTTLQRINQLLPPGLSVFQKKYDWYVLYRGKGTLPFSDGMRVSETSEPPDETPRKNPGKFSSPLDEYVYHLSLESTEEELGNVEDIGYHARLNQIEFSDIVRAAEDVGEDEHSARKAWRREFKGMRMHDTIQSAIIRVDNNGFVGVTYYTDERHADNAWEEIRTEYADFMSGADSGNED